MLLLLLCCLYWGSSTGDLGDATLAGAGCGPGPGGGVPVPGQRASSAPRGVEPRRRVRMRSHVVSVLPCQCLVAFVICLARLRLNSISDLVFISKKIVDIPWTSTPSLLNYQNDVMGMRRPLLNLPDDLLIALLMALNATWLFPLRSVCPGCCPGTETPTRSSWRRARCLG